MPTGSRIRTDNVFGTLTDNPLTNGATTMNSAGLANLAAVSGNHALIILDPLRSAGAPEAVIVTAHTGSATSATITRGAYGTSSRQHAQGTLWVHCPNVEDFIRIVTSSTRPSDPYEGQMIFETDTNKLVGYGGVDWASRDAGGQLAYAQITASTSAIGAGPTDITGLTVTPTVPTGRRLKISGQLQLNMGDASTAHFVAVLKDGTQLGLITAIPTGLGTNGIVAGGAVFDSPSAGSHTYKLTATRYAGSSTATPIASSTNPGWICVEDIGAA